MTAARLRTAFVAAAVAWAALLVITPRLASAMHASPIASALIVAVYGMGSLVCHQLPERSYQLWSAQMPVCARCAGIYFGAVFGALGARATQVSGGRSATAAALRAGAFALRHARIVLALAVTPSALTLVYEWATGDMPAHAIRAAAGFPIGVAVAWLVVAATDNQVN